MDCRLLGPLEVTQNRTPLELGGTKQRALLAVLLLNANRAVSRDRLIDDLWGDGAPESAAKMVQIHVSGLRKVLPDGLLLTHGSGYSLQLEDGAVDLQRFGRLAEAGRAALAAGDAETASARLHEALALWRGPALAEFGEPFAQTEALRLEGLRLAALEDRIEADLALGRHGDLPAELDALVAAHPLRERLRAQQMLALYRSGRQADALAAYRDAHRALSHELGIQPSLPLRELERRILSQDPALAGPVLPAGPAPPSPVPRPQATTRYVTNGGVSLAYQIFGEGELELVLVTGWVLPMELFWDEPANARFLERLGSFARVLLWDKRGTGLSDRLAPGDLPTVEERMEDLSAVMDAAGFERPAVFGISEGSALATLFAASHPERTRALALYGGWARIVDAPDYPAGVSREEFERFLERMRDGWADPGFLLRYWAPGAQHDERFRRWWGRSLRLGASPTTAAWWLHMIADVDLRAVLPAIRVPTLVMHRRGDAIVPVEHGRYLARQIPGAEYVEAPGADHLWWVGDQDELLDPLERFFTGTRAARAPERVLTTILFTDIVDSTRRAAELGDRRWRDLLGEHDRLVREQLAHFRGSEIKTLGDGFLAAFDGPTRAIRCAEAIRAAVAALGLEIRSGLHTGECELVGGDISGIAVNIGARVGALAGPGETLVSRTVADLVAGSDIRFEERGEHALRGLDGAFGVLAVARR